MEILHHYNNFGAIHLLVVQSLVRRLIRSKLFGVVYARGDYSGAEYSVVPVSYTHLDVYKRQLMRYPINV